DAPVARIPVPAAQIATVEQGLRQTYRLRSVPRRCGAAGTAGEESDEEERTCKLGCEAMLQGDHLRLGVSQSAHLFIYRRTFIYGCATNGRMSSFLMPNRKLEARS